MAVRGEVGVRVRSRGLVLALFLLGLYERERKWYNRIENRLYMMVWKWAGRGGTFPLKDWLRPVWKEELGRPDRQVCGQHAGPPAVCLTSVSVCVGGVV